MKAILYIGHGTRSKLGAAEAKSFMQRVIKRIDVPIQEVSFLELTEPPIEEGFQRCVDRGATEITVVPLFLLAAGHIKEDIPNVLREIGAKHPHVRVRMQNPFGVQAQILDAIVEIIRESAGEVTSRDALLIVGRGSSDPGIHAAFGEIADGIRDRLALKNVSVCYLAAAVPTLKQGLDTISQQGANRMIVLPYLLFSGLLLNEVKLNVRSRQKQGLNIIHTGTLSGHRVFEDIVIERASGKEAIHAATGH
ncbi:sirohydrochlorin chelatase [Bacillus sp. T33-2]|uniref:sirohydrochlorin chelatase n=1 Tax=Bacillus sp. T33-2 TaxID=2054168 RepID=UPI000C756B7E|nr:sirohydrochlorin chelatase [Bacillus sp. T33-2]PLR94871.1 sirohydrochlorin chelatase [Bacillus sp. T33-2]